MQTLLHDIRYALRTMGENAGFTTAAILALALGIGATTAIFSVVNGVILRPLPYPDPSRLAQIYETEPRLPTVPVNMSDYLDWKKQVRSFQSLAMYLGSVANLTGSGEPDRVRTMLAESTLLPMVGAVPVLGRNFLAEENQPGHEHEAILTYGFWKARYGGDSGVLGRKLMLDNEPYTIVGVLPADFRFLNNNLDIWLPLSFDLSNGNNQRGNHGLWVLGRLAPGVSVEYAGAELTSIAASVAKQYPNENAGVGAAVFILQERMLSQIRPALLVLLGAVGCVLLIACANVANLLLARAAARQKEMAIRIALGAGRGRIVRQLLTESVLLSFSAAAIGLLLAWWSISVVRGIKSTRIPRINEVVLDSHVLLFAIAITIFTTLLFGLAPALRMSSTGLAGAVRQAGGRTTETPGQRRVRMLLVSAEVCLATVLLVGSGLLIRSFVRVSGIDAGFRPDHVLKMTMALSSSRYQKGADRARFFDRALGEVRTIPGIRSAAFASKLPLLGGNNGPVLIDGHARPKTLWETPLVEFSRISPDYFRTMGIRLLRGRDFEAHDRLDASSVAIVNEAFVKKFLPDEDAIGKRLSHFDDPPKWKQVVGVVADVRQWGLEQKPLPEMYTPIAQEPSGYASLVARTDGDPLSFAGALKDRIRGVDAQQPVFEVDSMEHLTATQLGFRTFNTSLLLAFAAIAMALASIGIYGVISYSVAQRVPEIGIRMALGAQRGNVLGMILRQGMAPALLGAAAGIVASLGASRLLSSLLYGVTSTDTLTLALVAAGLVCVAALASYAPARRAASVDPLTALRYE